MKWTVSAETRTMEGDTEVPSVYVAFRSLEDPVVFRNLSYAEGQWIARQIASISEDEISEALAASGLSAAELLLAREKLVSIQQNYIQTFGLKKEFSQRLRKINKHLNFDPTHDQVIVHLHNGNQFRLETRNVGLKNGGLVYGWRK